MKKSIGLLCAALAIGPAALVTRAASADDKKHDEKAEKTVALDKIPAKARAAILREAGGSPIIDVQQESEDGKTVYEAHVRKGDEVIGIRVDAEGKLLGKHSEKNEKNEKNDQNEK